jgi:hypothetical protein
MLHDLARVEGVSPIWYSFFIAEREWLEGRREIRSFFIQEVDRDKLVLFGSALE